MSVRRFWGQYVLFEANWSDREKQHERQKLKCIPVLPLRHFRAQWIHQVPCGLRQQWWKHLISPPDFPSRVWASHLLPFTSSKISYFTTYFAILGPFRLAVKAIDMIILISLRLTIEENHRSFIINASADHTSYYLSFDGPTYKVPRAICIYVADSKKASRLSSCSQDHFDGGYSSFLEAI